MPALSTIWSRVCSGTGQVRRAFISPWPKPISTRKGSSQVWGERFVLPRGPSLDEVSVSLYGSPVTRRFCCTRELGGIDTFFFWTQDSFKDETEQTAAEYHVLPVNGPLGSRSPSEPRSTPSSTIDSALLTRNNSISHTIAEPRESSRSDSITSPQSSITPVSSPRLTNVNEAYLLRHFQRSIAPWVGFLPFPCAVHSTILTDQLDAGDPERHFCADVVGRASESPLLLYACLAVSACHLSRTTHAISPDVADGYHERCVSIMLPVLDNSNYEIAIDILLSSTVILRFFEQISCTNQIPHPPHPPTDAITVLCVHDDQSVLRVDK